MQRLGIPLFEKNNSYCQVQYEIRAVIPDMDFPVAYICSTGEWLQVDMQVSSNAFVKHLLVLLLLQSDSPLLLFPEAYWTTICPSYYYRAPSCLCIL
jgi:hypothetical protein